MHTTLAIALCALLSGVALAATTPSRALWEQQLQAFAQKHDILDYGQYRSGMIDTNELAIRAAKVFNEAAYRGANDTGNCKSDKAGETHTFSCDLSIPTIDKVVATIKLTVALDTTTLVLVIAGKELPLSSIQTAKFFDTGIQVSITKQLADFVPAVKPFASMLVAELSLTGKDLGNGKSDICINFKVGMKAPFGLPSPLPAPTVVPLTCQTVSMSAPSLSFFQKVLKVVTFGYWY